MNIEDALKKIEAAERLLQEAKTALTTQRDSMEVTSSPPETVEEAEKHSTGEHDINTLNGIVAQLLDLACQASDDQAEAVLAEITHATIDHKALASIMRFNWARLKTQVQDYLKTPSDPYSFTIIREQDRSSGNIAEKKLFLEAKSRNPVPLTLRKDIGEEHWRIYTFSL